MWFVPLGLMLVSLFCGHGFFIRRCKIERYDTSRNCVQWGFTIIDLLSEFSCKWLSKWREVTSDSVCKSGCGVAPSRKLLYYPNVTSQPELLNWISLGSKICRWSTERRHLRLPGPSLPSRTCAFWRACRKSRISIYQSLNGRPSSAVFNYSSTISHLPSHCVLKRMFGICWFLRHVHSLLLYLLPDSQRCKETVIHLVFKQLFVWFYSVPKVYNKLLK